MGLFDNTGIFEFIGNTGKIVSGADAWTRLFKGDVFGVILMEKKNGL